MAQIKRNNHFVPQFYLRQWSEDGKQIWLYRILVSQERVPEWKLRSISGIAYHADLYTTMADGHEIDEFERWIEAEYETPAQDAINKVIRNKTLKSEDCNRLAMFLAAQDVRTPTNYLESAKRWESNLPKIFDSTLKKAVRKLEQAHKDGRPIQTTNNDPEFFKNVIKVKVNPDANPSKGIGSIRAEMIIGRDLWLESQRLLLSKTAKALLNHKWSIAEPAKGNEWFTCDHPVIRLNYYGDGSYDLKGGWGNKGANLIMPLSPRHLLFTQIGSEFPDRFTFPEEITLKIQGFIAERALRFIYARNPIDKISLLRPRIVDHAAVKYEEEQWKKWHNIQSAIANKKSYFADEN
jgi:Protein of unknown function (DUF4238)